MKDILSRFTFPAVLILIGVGALVLGMKAEQNNLFMIGSAAILGVGLISGLSSMGAINKMVQLVLVSILGLGSAYLAYESYKSIKDPIDFMNERDKRYVKVIERLKDIRSAQTAYKNVNNKYTADFDSLIAFIKTDSFRVVKAIGTVPDTLTEEQALEMGLVSRDTVLIPIQDSIFSKTYLKGHSAFYIDSLPYVPYAKGGKFTLNAGVLVRNNVKVAVIEVVDGAPFDPNKVMKFGSMTDPNVSGNWE